MGQASVTMGLNVELKEGAKFDRFMPNIGMSVDISDPSLSIKEQIVAQKEAIQLIWKELSDTIEGLINEELDRPINWGK